MMRLKCELVLHLKYNYIIERESRRTKVGYFGEEKKLKNEAKMGIFW